MVMDKFLTTENICDKMQVKENTVRGWIKDGKLKALKVGRGWRIEPKDLDNFLTELKAKQAKIDKARA